MRFASSSCQPAFDKEGRGPGGIVGGSPAAPRRLEVVDVVQPVRFFDLTPAVRAIAGIYGESAAGARGGPGQIQIGGHSNVGVGSGTGTGRRIIVLWHSHRCPAASEGDRRRSGLPRGPYFAFLFQMSKTRNP